MFAPSPPPIKQSCLTNKTLYCSTYETNHSTLLYSVCLHPPPPPIKQSCLTNKTLYCVVHMRQILSPRFRHRLECTQKKIRSLIRVVDFKGIYSIFLIWLKYNFLRFWKKQCYGASVYFIIYVTSIFKSKTNFVTIMNFERFPIFVDSALAESFFVCLYCRGTNTNVRFPTFFTINSHLKLN